MDDFNSEQKSKLKKALDELVLRVEEKASEAVIEGSIDREELKPILDFMRFSIIQLMENLGLFLSEYLEDVSKSYIQIGAKKISISITSLVMLFSFILFGGIMICFLAVGLALYIGQLFGQNYFGFFVVGFIVFLLALLVYGFKNKLIKQPLEKAILSQWME